MATKLRTVKVTADGYQDHADNDNGVCLACGEWSEGGCEPDAENYECEACGERAVFGASQALVMGKLAIIDDDGDMDEDDLD